jgi:hypothetical protein
MADRKQFQNVPVADPELKRLLEDSAPDQPVTEEELHEQRISLHLGMLLRMPS